MRVPQERSASCSDHMTYAFYPWAVLAMQECGLDGDLQINGPVSEVRVTVTTRAREAVYAELECVPLCLFKTVDLSIDSGQHIWIKRAACCRGRSKNPLRTRA